MARARKQKSAEHAEGVARKIWLAGLGAYGKSFEDAQGQLGKAGQEASKLFHDLVEKGQGIEGQSRSVIRSRLDEARDRIDEARSRISERAESNTRSVEELIQRVRDRVAPDSTVHAKLNTLTRRVDALASALGKLGASKPANRGARKASAGKGRSAPTTTGKPAKRAKSTKAMKARKTTNPRSPGTRARKS